MGVLNPSKFPKIVGFRGRENGQRRPVHTSIQQRRQFVLYDRMLKRYYPGYALYLAVPEEIGVSVFEEEAGQTLIEDGTIQVVTFDAEQEVLVRWMP